VSITETVFAADVAALYVLLVGAGWSIARPAQRVWPPPHRLTWQHRLTWLCFYFVFAANALLLFLDWNNGALVSASRFLVGGPLALAGTMLVTWGIVALGRRNTSGVRDGFVVTGPYRYTRNPQYLGDMLLFVGLSLVANSPYLWVTHGLLILVFLMASWAEEAWLVEQYGNEYAAYRGSTPRFM
jgi:protein-S-isoprenylcysteine O-methyltransferase Ste14